MKKYLKLILIALLCICVSVPVFSKPVSAATVRVSFNSKSTSYKNRKNTVYVAGKKVNISKTPIFMKSGAYVGTVNEILKKAGVKTKESSDHKTITLTYGSNKVILKNGSRTVTYNGKTDTIGAIAFRGKYTSSGKTRWIVPLKSVCKRLGLKYTLSNGVIRITKPATTAAGSTTATTGATTATKSTTTTSKSQVCIVLDAGHGGIDSGATGNGLKEKNLTLAIVLAAKKCFDNDSRFKVYYTRTSDTYPSLSDRSSLANNVKADIFISVHINSATASATGTETLYNSLRNSTTAKNGVTSKDLASAMQSAAVQATGFRNRGLVDRKNSLHVLRCTNMPACLIEYGFISNTVESAQMKAKTTYYGQQLYKALVNYSVQKGLTK